VTGVLAASRNIFIIIFPLCIIHHMTVFVHAQTSTVSTAGTREVPTLYPYSSECWTSSDTLCYM
jgi:hypothetical protein